MKQAGWLSLHFEIEETDCQKSSDFDSQMYTKCENWNQIQFSNDFRESDTCTVKYRSG